MQPGDTITPGGQPQAAPEAAATHPVPAEQSSTPSPAPQQTAPQPEPPQPVNAPDPEPVVEANAQDAAWAYSPEPDSNPYADSVTAPQSGPVQWSASEYIAHHKNAGWFVLVGVGAVVAAGLIYLLTQEIVSAVVVAVMGVLFAVAGGRPPRVLNYSLDNNGLTVEQKFYPYGLFKSFSVIEEGAVRSILLMPLQRFGLPITIYYDPADEPAIIEVISLHLPHVDRQAAPIDNLMRKIRF